MWEPQPEQPSQQVLEEHPPFLQMAAHSWAVFSEVLGQPLLDFFVVPTMNETEALCQ